MLHSHPPRPGAGDISARTAALRPAVPLTEAQIDEARRLRRVFGLSTTVIAGHLEAEEDTVERALLAMRTPKDDRSRASLNVTLAARDFALANQYPGESMHATVDRLFAELEMFRGGAA